MIGRLLSLHEHVHDLSTQRSIEMEPTDPADIRMVTAKGAPTTRLDDIYMDTTKATATTKMRRNVLKVWETEILKTPEVKRKATVAQLCK